MFLINTKKAERSAFAILKIKKVKKNLVLFVLLADIVLMKNKMLIK